MKMENQQHLFLVKTALLNTSKTILKSYRRINQPSNFSIIKNLFILAFKWIPVDIMKKFNAFVPLISKEFFFCCDSAGFFWWKNNINKFADADSVINVSASVNNPAKINTDNPVGKIGGYSDRLEAYNWLKDIMNYEECN